MEAPESAEILPSKDTFDIAILTKEIDKEIIESAKRAVVAVWRQNVNQPTTHKITFWDYLGNNPATRTWGEYVPEYDRFHFAMKAGMFEEFGKIGLPKEAAMFLIAAHEAMHRVQIKHRGDKYIPSRELTTEEYKEAANEREAWEEAMHAFKKEYPDAEGGFGYGDVKFEIPKISKYK